MVAEKREREREEQGKNRDGAENSGQEGRPKRQRRAPLRFVDEYRDDIEEVLNSPEEPEDDDVEDIGDISTPDDEDAEYELWVEEHQQEITAFSLTNQLSFDAAAILLYTEEDAYEDSFICDSEEEEEDREFSEGEEEEEDFEEDDTEDTEDSESESEVEITDSSEENKENLENQLRQFFSS